MKNKLLDYLLIGTYVYKRPLKKRILLFLLFAGSGLVIMLDYSARYGFGFMNNVFSIVATVVLVLFSGIFSSVMYCWPAADLIVSLSGESGKINLVSKRMKLIKGFLFAVIYTGTISVFLKLFIYEIMDFKVASFISVIIPILVSLWAGAMLTRCIRAVFEDIKSNKFLIFIAASIWYYLIAIQIIGFIINSAYSIIL